MRRIAANRVFNIRTDRLRTEMANVSKNTRRTIAAGRMRKTATACARMAVGLLLGSAVTIAVVAAGIDLFPLRP